MVAQRRMDQFARPNTPADVASATLTEVADAARNQYDSVLVAMRRNPFTSVAIAAGVGLGLALAVRYYA